MPKIPGNPQWVIEELRDQALRDALELGLDEDDSLWTAAADLIALYDSALKSIAAGEQPAKDIAEKALDYLSRLKKSLD